MIGAIPCQILEVLMSSSKTREACLAELRNLLSKPNYGGSLPAHEKVVELTSYMDTHFQTQFNVSLVSSGKWIGPSCDDCDDYECSESQFVSCEMGSYYVESYLTRLDKDIGFGGLAKMLDEFERNEC